MNSRKVSLGDTEVLRDNLSGYCSGVIKREDTKWSLCYVRNGRGDLRFLRLFMAPSVQIGRRYPGKG